MALIAVAVLAVSAGGSGAATVVTVDVDNPGAILDEATTTFTFTVNASAIIESVEFKLAMAHAYPEDLHVTLTSPNGTSVVLFELTNPDNHGEVDTVEYRDILFVYSASPTRQIGTDANDAPYTGTYQIQDPSVGDGDLNVFAGENTYGVWMLTIVDDTAGDAGTLYGDGQTAEWGTADGTKLILNVVPEPATLSMLALGMLALVVRARRRRTA